MASISSTNKNIGSPIFRSHDNDNNKVIQNPHGYVPVLHSIQYTIYYILYFCLYAISVVTLGVSVCVWLIMLPAYQVGLSLPPVYILYSIVGQ